ncbi:MAG: type II toxin-antitoxin system HicA family toxin [Candidatus Eremiobacteraeota bacterium]|nr:type II toxin-antitoxin system HicA family toxin [Candidatus Eremiobacteraeota bacterium]
MKKDKLLQNAIRNPQNLRFDGFQSLLKGFRFRLDRVSGSHHIYKNDHLQQAINIQPTKEGKAKKYQVRDFIRILEGKNVI